MRVSSYDALELERQIGPRDGTSGVTSANRALVQNWLVAQGVPSENVKRMKLSTLWKCYNKPRYLAAVLSHLSGEGGDPDSAADTADLPIADNRDSVTSVIAPQLGNHTAALMLQSAIKMLASESINEERVIELIREHASRPLVATVEVKDELGITVDVGLQHRQFPLLLKACAARIGERRLNVWLSGPAGSGKTTAAENVATALGLPFAFNGAIDTEYKLLGFTDAQGRVVSRPFRQVYEHGGVYLFDEIDRSMPSAVLAFNAALANGVCDFPDGPVRRHPDCVIIAAANTYGLGAGADQYVGAMKQDAAFLDRFVYINWQIDADLERAVCPDSEWCDYVQAVRTRVAVKGMRVIVSPRASLDGAALLAAGIHRDSVVQMTLRKGMSDEQWESVR